MSPNIMMFKIALFVLAVLVIYYRNMYIFCGLLIFFMDYWYFIMFLIDVYNKYGLYHRIEVSEFNYNDRNLIHLWCSYSKLVAFEKLYVLLSRKKLTLSRILYALLIMFLNVPLRIMKLFYFFIFENKKSLFGGLSDLHFRKFLKLKSLKIEIYDGKIFLNCFTINKLISKIQINRRLKHNELHQLLINLNKIAIMAENAKPKLGEIDMTLSKIRRESTIVSNVHHYTYKYDTKNFVHSTSNVPNNLKEFQKIGPAIPNMVKENSKNPGSIWSSDVTSYDEKNISKKVEVIDMFSNAYQCLGKEHIPSHLIGYHDFVFDSYKDALIDALGPSGYSNVLLQELSNGNFSHVLLTNNESSLIDEIEAWKDENS